MTPIAMQVLHAIGGLVLILSLAGVAYTLAAARFAKRLARPGPPRRGSSPSVTVLKPLFGAEPGLADNLSSFANQDYPAPVQIICGVRDPEDPALAAVHEAKARHPGAQFDIVADPRVHGANGKVSNLMNMAEQARHDLIVLSDSDIAVAPDYLARIAAAAAVPGVGAVTCYYFGQGMAGGWSRLAAMGVSYGFLPNVLMGVGLGMAHPCMGSTIAMRREVLDEIGGFAAFADVLADDYEIGRAIRDRGQRIVLPDLAVAHGCTERGLRELFAHELRWAVTVRIIDPVGHAGSVITHAVPLALIGGMLCGEPGFALAALAAALASRLWLRYSVDRAVGRSSGPWTWLIARDLLSFGVFIGSLFARAVYWRGARFGVSSGRKFFPA